MKKVINITILLRKNSENQMPIGFASFCQERIILSFKAEADA